MPTAQQLLYIADSTLVITIYDMKCWRTATVLVILQVCTGATLITVAIHAAFITPSLSVRHFPLWAAIPLLISGIIGTVLVFGCRNRSTTKKSVFSFKVACFALSSISTLTCVISSVLLYLHIFLYINRYDSCTMIANDCVCRKIGKLSDQIFTYDNIECLQLFSTIRILMIIKATLSGIGGISSCWFLALLWSSQYDHIYAGVSLDDVSTV